MPTSATALQLVNGQLADVTLEDLFSMRTLALLVGEGPTPDQVREDAFTAELFAARARRQATAAEVLQVRTRMRVTLEYMSGERGKHPHSPTAAEAAAGRDPEYLRAKEACAETWMVATVAEAIARDLAALAYPFPLVRPVPEPTGNHRHLLEE
ncbi:MAG TPA: hypothetical protein VFR37_05475 [Longimicrobium sp.]|nr:hypothetical protein [Longimicrobium sp.]